MRIVCPTCDTAYDAPESVLAAGRPMRCARCRTEWIPGHTEDTFSAPEPAPVLVDETPPAAEPSGLVPSEPVAEQVPEHETMRAADMAPKAAEPVILAPYPTLPPPVQARKTVLAGWAVSVMVLVCGVWLAIDYREPVMRHWPASARAYAVLGYR